MRHAGICAGGNLLIAQHRDKLRYATVRSGAYLPQLRRYEVGDYVYYKRGQPNNTLDMSAHSCILRVVGFTDDGNLILTGRDGHKMSANVLNCAPCHLPNIKDELVNTDERPSEWLACEVCRFPDGEETLLLCDVCDRGWHTQCLTPPLAAVPEGAWVCPTCLERGHTPGSVPERVHVDKADRRHSLFRSTQQRKAFQEAEQLDGSHVHRDYVRGQPQGPTGVATLDRSGTHPTFDVEFEDGTSGRMSLIKVKNRRINAIVAVLLDPSAWNLTEPAGVAHALELLMPGGWPAAHTTRLSNQLNNIHRIIKRGEPTPLVPTTPGEIHALLERVDFTQVGSILDPWAGTCAISEQFAKAGLQVWSSDINPCADTDTHGDALQPSFYRCMARRMGLGAIVTSPWFAVLDLALPLAVMAARCVACVHVPGHYITDAHPRRASYLQGLMASSRVHIVFNGDKGPMGRRCAWLLVFADAATKQMMLLQHSGAGQTCTYA